MRIYLDNCALQRPLDDKNQIRIVLESEAILGVIALYESGTIEIVSSEVLLFEINSNPSSIRKEYALGILKDIKEYILINDLIEKRAEDFNKKGIKPIDSLHLACAETANVSYFCTCDDKFLRKAKSINNLGIKVVSPLELIEELEK